MGCIAKLDGTYSTLHRRDPKVQGPLHYHHESWFHTYSLINFLLSLWSFSRTLYKIIKIFIRLSSGHDKNFHSITISNNKYAGKSSEFIPVYLNLFILVPEIRGVHGYVSIRESANPIQPNPLFTRTHSLAGRTQPNPPNPQIIGSGIGFEFLNPSTRKPNPLSKCISERCCCKILYALFLLSLYNLLLDLI
jgi:hypothetical protein